MKQNEALLVLEDGFSLEGVSFGVKAEAFGEVVFNTSMMGYQEILTDPSYKGQIVTMTYPLIGNYGINEEDVESNKPWVEGFMVKENSTVFSNWRAKGSLDNYLKKNKIVGIEGIDTRALTKHIRLRGAMKGGVSAIDLDKKSLLKKVRSSPGLVGRDLVKEVTCPKEYTWPVPNVAASSETLRDAEVSLRRKTSFGTASFNVIVMDFGLKYNILRSLNDVGCRVKVVPAKTKASEILALKPDGLLLSNGPGDPAAVSYAIEEIKKLLGKLPIFGICLGHQLLALALGGKTYKLKFGHHGGNQPVMNLRTKRVEITAQNHGFAVKVGSIPDKDVEVTHINLNDKTNEGMRHKKLPIFSVQYHPEASPGPHDASYLFEDFIKLMPEGRNAVHRNR